MGLFKVTYNWQGMECHNTIKKNTNKTERFSGSVLLSVGNINSFIENKQTNSCTFSVVLYFLIKVSLICEKLLREIQMNKKQLIVLCVIIFKSCIIGKERNFITK